MLVITRKVDEGIQVGDNIRITVVEIKGHSVKLGIEAPRDVPIHRDEIAQKIRDSRPEGKPAGS